MKTVPLVMRLIRVSRPFVWLPYLAIVSAGTVLAGSGWGPFTLFALFYSTLPMGIMGYGLNDIADRDSDAINKRKDDGIEGVVVRPQEFRMLHSAIAVNAILPAVVFALGGRYLAAGCTLVILLFGYVYSVKPFRLKERPFIDSFSNGILWIVPLFLLGYFANTKGFVANWPDWRILVVLAMASAALHAIAAALDYEADNQVGVRTIAVAIGKRWAMVFAAALFAVSYFFLPYRVFGLFVAICEIATLVTLARPTYTNLWRLTYFIAVILVPLFAVYMVLKRLL